MAGHSAGLGTDLLDQGLVFQCWACGTGSYSCGYSSREGCDAHREASKDKLLCAAESSAKV